MSQFLRLLVEDDKAAALTTVCARLRQGENDSRAFSVVPEAFDCIPGKPFAYWVSKPVRETFRRDKAALLESLASGGASTRHIHRSLRKLAQLS